MAGALDARRARASISWFECEIVLSASRTCSSQPTPSLYPRPSSQHQRGTIYQHRYPTQSHTLTCAVGRDLAQCGCVFPCATMQTQASTSFTSPFVPSRFAALIWSCLDADLNKSAMFYAERYYAMYQDSHDARHLYATALLRAGQPHTAHHLVNMPACARCSGCLEVKSKCSSALGRHRQSREALEACLKDPKYTPTRTSCSVLSFGSAPTCYLRCSIDGFAHSSRVSRRERAPLSIWHNSDQRQPT